MFCSSQFFLPNILKSMLSKMYWEKQSLRIPLKSVFCALSVVQCPMDIKDTGSPDTVKTA